MGASHSVVEDVVQADPLNERTEQEYDDFRERANRRRDRGRKTVSYILHDREKMRSFIAEYNREQCTRGYLRLKSMNAIIGMMYDAVFDTDPSPA